MSRTLNLYFLRRFLTNFTATLAVLFALVYLIDMIEVSRRGRFEDAGLLTIAAISALRVPTFIEQAFPFVVLFSAIFTLISLNRKLELVVARAAGVSVWQILFPFIAGSILLGLVATFVYNPVAAFAQSRSASLQTELSGGDTTEGDGRAPFLRQFSEGVDSIIGAKAVSDGGIRLGGVTAFVMAEDGTVSERIDAPSAHLEAGRWRIESPTVTRPGYPPQRLASFDLPTSLRPEYVEQRLADPQAIPIWELGSKIEIARSLGYNAEAFAMHYNTLIAKPALFVAMTLLAATVAVKFARTGQSSRTIAGGITAGFVLYVVTFLAQALGSNSVVPPVVAAWFPVLAAGLFGVTILLHQEDG
ncbi:MULTISPECIES: LPS export ABC transporter permease LptG [unclassified Aureimonas]|uniref:LPS export ABC transporter permease LptG n=1 Tax=unclassified Aureimonas TaxID=2615206 RepID=UPI0006F878FE|nr:MULTISPECIES: LPS export ABC transporter permease LptG [unclassified Aureimonas]KQT52930.1 LPS export ABC transporter permease LptG [Aureimonas sp. Leaf427]KQT80389.1 LPS export ABC transporter permease LptG [Aureimonas sp. Leaf460]